jgi:hypothetical protein
VVAAVLVMAHRATVALVVLVAPAAVLMVQLELQEHQVKEIRVVIARAVVLTNVAGVVVVPVL